MKKIFIIICLLIIISGCNLSEAREDERELLTEETFKLIDEIKDEINLEMISIYGRFFNVKGILKSKDNYKLVLKNESFEKEFELYNETKDNKIIFTTNKLINEGINLENIEEGSYLILLKKDNTYYNLKKNGNYKNLEYYSITKNNKNKKITIEFKKNKDKEYLTLECSKTTLSDNIYDIVIDPGHGGKDIGASNKNYTESKINLEYGLLLKEKLNKLGLKVKLTREKDDYISNYGKNSRVSVPYITKAKLMLSIHLNSSNLNVRDGGVEIYVPNHSNINFAKNMASNIVNKTGGVYSKNSSSKVDNGVYLRTLLQSDIEDIKKEAERDGYIPYETATTDSTYYFIIRETGGIVTGAYIDGRNPKKEGNLYYNSNHGCESYLVELGYISSKTNLDLLLNKKDEYVDALVESIKNELNIGS